MLCIKEKDRYYFIESMRLIADEGRHEQLSIAENMPFFKANNSDILIAGYNIAALDALRYTNLKLPSKLSFETINNKIMPEIASVWYDLGRLDEYGDPPTSIFLGKNDKAFVIDCEGNITELEDACAYGWRADYFGYALALTSNSPLNERIQKIYKAVEQISGNILFPLIMTDTKSFNVNIIEEEG